MRAALCEALKAGLALFLACTLVVTLTPSPAMGQSGATTDNSGIVPFDQAFFAFEVESVLESLKDEPIWDELEQMLDNPYQFTLAPDVIGNYQHWPSYRSTQARRASFIYRLNGNTGPTGVPCAPGSANCVGPISLQGHIIHPPNFNYQSGEELRLLNPGFTSRNWPVPDELRQRGTSNTWLWTYRNAAVTDGADRVEGEAAIDYNSPIASDLGLATGLLVPLSNLWNNCSNPLTCNIAAILLQAADAQGACITSTEPIPVEGAQVCGGDPGEPGYLGFGVLGTTAAQRRAAYSTPALPLPLAFRSPQANIATAVQQGARLVDPAGCADRNAESPESCTTVAGGGAINRLRKPTLRSTPSSQPNYAQNTEPDDVAPSNENDYYRGNNRTQKQAARAAAAALGKALFWEMQVGSDTVQACASCHFTAGADNRTKNQTNPNHLGGHTTLELHGGVQNTDLVPSDFPFHKCDQDDLSPSCHVDDVASSMGVRYRLFLDIPPIGTGANQSFGDPDGFGIRTLLPDIGNDPAGGQALDPIPLFQGLRRVEPRNTPTLFNAAMNFDNFWDGRARHDFNGGSVFGPSDPQNHVFVGGVTGNLTATRQIIRFASLASLATGPALSEFEMSFDRRNWPKLGKKLLQGDPLASGLTAAGPALIGRVTPLANQLVSTTDSVLGIYSNQGGSACTGLPDVDRVAGWTGTAPNKPGLCISYPGLIRQAYYPALWQNGSQHLNGCYTDGDLPPALHRSPQCAANTVAIQVLNTDGTGLVNSTEDPFDHYVLTPATSAAVATDTNQFSQMEANMSLFFGLAVHAWGLMLVPDDSPFDRFADANPDSYVSFGESGEPSLVPDILTCAQTGGAQPCFTEVGNFKRDPGVIANVGCTGALEGCTQIVSGGTRSPGAPDPLLGLDVFLGSNLSLKNPNFRSLRCGECHAQGTLTDNTFGISNQTTFNDWVVEFREGQPGNEIFPEPLGRNRVISGFALEGELNGNAQDAIERNIADLCVVAPCEDAPGGNSVPGGITGGFPQGQALFDNGVYNLGITPIANDVGRGGKDAFGWPLSLSYLMLKNLGGLDYSPGGDDPSTGFAQPGGGGNPLPNFDPSIDPTGGGLLEETAQDQELNPGFEEEPGDPQLPAYLAPWANHVNVGDEVQQDEVFTGLNTLAYEPQLEGFVDNFGPFNPAATLGENMNSAVAEQMGTWPNVNRVNTQGAFKAAPLRHVARTGPYFHNGGKLTLRQVLDFYMRGGDLPKTNGAHRDFLVVRGDVEDEALGGCLDATRNIVDPNPQGGCPAGSTPEFTEAQKEEIKTSVIDFLLELTDERVDFQRAPFDQVEIFVPLDGTAPDNGSLGAVPAGRQGFLSNLANGLFRQVSETGAGGKATPSPNFLGVAQTRKLATACAVGELNHYCP